MLETLHFTLKVKVAIIKKIQRTGLNQRFKGNRSLK